MMAVKSGNGEIKHCDSDVGQIKLEKWVSECLVARGWGQQRKIMRAELEHEDNFFTLLRTVLVEFLLHWTHYVVAVVKGKIRGRKRKRKIKKKCDSKYCLASTFSFFFPNSNYGVPVSVIMASNLLFGFGFNTKGDVKFIQEMKQQLMLHPKCTFATKTLQRSLKMN